MTPIFKTCGFCLRSYDDWEAHAHANPSCLFQKLSPPRNSTPLSEPTEVAEDDGFLTYKAPISPVVTMGVKDEPALRFDGGKSRVDLIDPGFILRLGEHYGVGAKKYSEYNWQKGMSFSRCYASAQRHMLAFWSGEEHDEETGSRHVIAAAWNMAAIDYYLSNPALREKFDDRPKGLNS